jgi:P-type Na+/K+ transporter
LTRLAHFLFIAAVLLLIILFAISKFRLTSAVALYAISLAVAIIPESLIAVVTTCLAKSVARLAHHKVLVLRLDAIETLGAIHDICSDKTGTITMGNMAVRKVSNGKKIWECRGGELTLGEQTLECVHGEGDMLEIIRCAALCNDAVVTLKPDKWHSNGEATEVTPHSLIV